VSTPDLSADFESHHIEGFARAAIEQGQSGEFKVPLISQITDDLWTGGWLPDVKLPDDFLFVVSMYPWGKYELGLSTARIEVAMQDSDEVPDRAQLFTLGRIVNAFRGAGKTLVHCQAGLNRSALVAGVALILDGHSPDEAIALLRSRSEVVLCNAAFERCLREWT
jgi:hypothetical protein